MSSGRYNLGTLQELSDSGVLQPGYKVRFKISGTDTLQDTYQDPGLTAPNTNPIVADANGRITVNVFISDKPYKAEILRPDDTVIDTYDPLYKERVIIEAASFPANPWPDMEVILTTDGNRYRRNRANTAWVNLGPYDSIGQTATVTDVTTGTSTTTIVTPDALAGLWEKGTNIVAASSLVIPSTEGGYFVVTGNTTITGISAAADGRKVTFRFTGTPQLTDGANFDLGTSGNIQVTAGDLATFVRDGTAWYLVDFKKANNNPISVSDYIATQAELEADTILTKFAPVGRIKNSPGVAKAWVNWDNNGSSGTTTEDYNVSSLTDSGVGISIINFTTSFGTAGYGCSMCCGDLGGDTVPSWYLIRPSTAAGKTVSACRINHGGGDYGASSIQDFNFNSMSFDGDQ